MLIIILLFLSILSATLVIEQYYMLSLASKLAKVGTVRVNFNGTLVLIETIVFALSTSILIYLW